MAKTAFPVDRKKLEASIVEAEAGGPLANRSALHIAVEGIYNLKEPPKQITSAVIGLRIKEWSLSCATPIGKRGRAKGESFGGVKGKRTSRSEKFQKNPKVISGFKKLRKELSVKFQDGKPAFPSSALSMMNRLESGSMKAAVALKCLDCAGGSILDVKLCNCNSCPLFAFRRWTEDTVTETEKEAA